MGRSLQIRQDRIDEVKSSVKLRGFPSQSALAMELGLSRATVNNYLNGKSVDYLNFVKISEKLGLSWLEISLQDEPIKKDGILIKKKVFALNRELKVNFKDFFKALTKAIIDLKTGKITRLPGHIIDGLYSVSLDLNSPTIAWQLIFRSLSKAIFSLVEDNQSLFSYKYKNFNLLQEQIEFSLEEKEIIIDRSFFNHPKELSILKEIEQLFKQWLQSYRLTEAQATSICNRLPNYFVFALNDEWRDRQPEYHELHKHLITPFSEVGSKEQSWLRYSAWLQKQVDEPMFAEAFSLNQVYVEPIAYYEKEIKNNVNNSRDREQNRKAEKRYKKIVIDLSSYLDDWLTKSNKDDAIRIISGDPGAGKSSFAKMFAARQAEKQQIPILFIPLHHFDATGDLVDAIGKFIRDDDYLAYNPLDGELKESRLLIIFDGLDELSMQGKIGAEVARSFIDEVQKTISRINYRQIHLQVIISGRPIAISSNKDEFRKSEQIIHILPYFTPEDKRQQYQDEQDLLKEDKRNIWWQKYGEATGKNYQRMPSELKLDNLFEITIQPLLNYLIALSYTRSTDTSINSNDKIVFSEDTNINSIYEDLLKSVYDRGWDTTQHPTLKRIEYHEFVRILEEIALAAWHGNGRTTTVKAIESHCESSGLKRLLEIFTEGAKTGVTNLLTSFYFRQSGYSNEGDRTFEFTHKSFGEYLTARRIVRELKNISEELQVQEKEFDKGWDEKYALTHWVTVCGMTQTDFYLSEFISREITMYKVEDVQQWQLTLCHLIEFMLDNGMPMEKLNPRPSYREEFRQSRNAEQLLLVSLNHCANYTNKISNIDWKHDYIFHQWLKNLQNSFRSNKLPNRRNIPVMIVCFLNYLNLEKADLFSAHLISANLCNANLKKAELNYASLTDANLYEANLEEAYLENTDLEGAKLGGASLKGANLENANLQKANLCGANLNNANLKGVKLEGAQVDKSLHRKLKLLSIIS